ncbi:MAG: hypothetical protein H0V82_03530 [Candidatus Protochlamydia sp.]|nr:hypothetical protein [Candidatus Protochlamydia sp.]
MLTLQSPPFSSIEVEGKGGGYHGESIKNLENSIQKGIVSDIVAFLAKFFDERAIEVLLKNSPHAKIEITAYLVMGLIQALRGYLEAKKYFYDNSQFGFGQSKLQAITDVLFSYSKQEKENQWQPIRSSTNEDRELTLEALNLVNKLRRSAFNFAFVGGV